MEMHALSVPFIELQYGRVQLNVCADRLELQSPRQAFKFLFLSPSFLGNRQTVGKEAEDHAEGKVTMLHGLVKNLFSEVLLDI